MPVNVKPHTHKVSVSGFLHNTLHDVHVLISLRWISCLVTRAANTWLLTEERSNSPQPTRSRFDCRSAVSRASTHCHNSSWVSTMFWTRFLILASLMSFNFTSSESSSTSAVNTVRLSVPSSPEIELYLAVTGVRCYELTGWPATP